MKRILSFLIGVYLACGAPEAQSREPTPALINVNIAPQSLTDALNAWADQTGFQVICLAPDLTRALTAPSVQGAFTPKGALDRLLAGTPLEYEFVNERAVTIRGPKEMRLVQEELTSAGDERRIGNEDDQPSDMKSEEPTEIVVTGTHIRGASPTGSQLTVYDRETIERTGAANVEQLLRAIPQNLSSIDSGTSITNGGGRDINSNAWFGATVNLHGLGSGSTLVLLNGQRLAPAGGQGEFVDVSLIPLSAVERVEILTDGASALYGSDAVAGVVNFILRQDYQGAETALQFGESTDGGAGQFTASQVLGTRWRTGNAMLVYEYQDQNSLFARQRDFVPLTSLTEPGMFEPLGSFTLLPQQRRNSALVSAHQALNEESELYASGFWSQREFDNTELRGGVLLTETYMEGTVEQLGGSIGFTRDLARQWRMEIVTNISRLEQDQVQRNVTSNLTRALNFVTTVSSLDLRSDGPLINLPAGPVHGALGIGARREGVEVAETTFVPRFNIERDVFSAYGEVVVPILGPADPGRRERLAVSLALRHDRYDDFGSATEPKVGLSWTPFQGLSLRGTYSRAYKAPTLIQRHETSTTYQLLSIPNSNDDDGYTQTILIGGVGNTALQPERARSLTAGFDLTPPSVPKLSVSMSYFQVNYSDRVSGPPLVGTTFDIYSQEDTLAPFINRNVDQAEIDRILSEELFENFSGPDFSGSVDPHLTEAFYDDRERNIAVTKESGVDISATYGFQLGGGTAELSLSGTKLFKMDYQVAPTTPVAELLNKTFRPMDLRLRGSAAWTLGGLTTSATLNYSDGYENNLIDPTGHIHSWLTLDLQFRYAVENASKLALLRNTTIGLTILNTANEDPPAVPYGGLLTNFNYDSANASPRGRFITLQVVRRW